MKFCCVAPPAGHQEMILLALPDNDWPPWTISELCQDKTVPVIWECHLYILPRQQWCEDMSAAAQPQTVWVQTQPAPHGPAASGLTTEGAGAVGVLNSLNFENKLNNAASFSWSQCGEMCVKECELEGNTVTLLSVTFCYCVSMTTKQPRERIYFMFQFSLHHRGNRRQELEGWKLSLDYRGCCLLVCSLWLVQGLPVLQPRSCQCFLLKKL